ncbi:hypothetical protein GCM10022393_09570 [Aquimarina addita]|uniref:PKD/Chitinase domain-containing protein n=2 Tax=Aquimarina addita TaxID=870485 RepID=A0ABP7XD86_9FLAO
MIALLFLLGCAREEAVPVSVDFDYEVFNEDFSIPVQLVFFNKTEGADEYEWIFEGATPSRSVNRSPGVIEYTEKGIYAITLSANNQDGEQDTMTVEIQIDAPVLVDFEVTNLIDTFSPATYTIQNNSSGADRFSWIFEGGTPATSSQESPGDIIFAQPGEHLITLEISNGRETYTQQKTITVAPFLMPDFDYEVAFIDNDFQVPVTIQFQNNSVSATGYQWSFEGSPMSTSIEEHPEVTFTTPGTHNILLVATNGKETQRIQKEITFFTDTNLRVLEDIKLGINTAHTASSVGSFYDLTHRVVYTAADIEANPSLGRTIELVFYGLSNAFTTNSFVSPDDLSETAFLELENAQQTIVINSQELCNCSASLTVAQFDEMQEDSPLDVLTIEETAGGIQDFDNTMMPRVVLFQTEAGKKGAIKIKEFVIDGQNSYILVDIKVQKVES